jgi:hypothetical protein
MPGEHLDLSSEPDPSEQVASGAGSRRYVGIHFVCCSVYTRVYVNKDETAYVGFCPKCSKRVELRIGAGGTEKRFFTAY